MRRSLVTWSVALVGAAVAWSATPGAQAPAASAAKSSGKASWLTDGGDNQRTAWQKNETLITKDSVKNMKLMWKLQLDNKPRQMHNLFPPLLVSDVTTSQGAKDVAVVAGVSDNVYGVDIATGKLLWSRKFDSTFVEPTGGRGPGVLCPGGLTATPVVAPTDTAGRFIVYAISWDGRLRTLDAATGTDVIPAEPFLPPNGKPYGLNLFKNVIYTTTAQGCGGNPNAFYGYDLETKKVGQYLPGSGGLWPRTGPSIGKDGTVYAGSGDGDYYPERQVYGQSIIGVKQNAQTKALELKDWFTPTNAFWLRKRDLDMNVTGPVFDFKGKEYMVQSSKECRLWLLDTSELGGEDHRTPVYRTPLICNEDVNFAAAGIWGALATWEDAKAHAGFSRRSGDRSTRSSTRRLSTATSCAVASRRSRWKKRPASSCSRRRGCRATWIRPSRPSSPTASFSHTAAARTPRRPTSTTASGSTPPPIAWRSSSHATSMRSTRTRARSCGRAASRSPRSTTSAGCRSPTGASTSAPTTACSTASVSTPRRHQRTRDSEGATEMKPQSTHVIGAVVIASACAAAMVQAQGRGGEWTTSRGDAQRTSWVRTDVRLTKDAVQKGELKFLWKMKLDNDTRQLNALTTPVLMDRLISHRGFKALAFLGGSSERMYAVDTDLAPRLLDDGHQLLVDHAAGEQLVGLPRRADRRRDAADVVCCVGVRRRRRWRPRWPVGELCW